jgi:transketolase
MSPEGCVTYVSGRSPAADLYGSTNISSIGKGFGTGFWHPTNNPESRLFSAGGIAEDAMGGICSGISTMGYQMGVGSSYGAFIAPLNTICAKHTALDSRHSGTVYPVSPTRHL